MEKKYPKKRWMSTFDHVLLNIAWLFWAILMGMAIYSQMKEDPGINMIIFVIICVSITMPIAI